MSAFDVKSRGGSLGKSRVSLKRPREALPPPRNPPIFLLSNLKKKKKLTKKLNFTYF